MQEGINEVLKFVPQLFTQTEGHISKKEARFLALLPFLNLPGEILEIGSYKGKSTIILAKAAQIAGMERIHACDPLIQSSSTDPKDYPEENLPEIFQSNLIENGVKDFIHFYEVKSEGLSRTWNLPIKALWVDGDHTIEGANLDFHIFKEYLIPGAVVAFHDVLHDFEGPVSVFIREMLQSNEFGDCGIWGSIGWAQYIKGKNPTKRQINRKNQLSRKLSKFRDLKKNDSALHKINYNIRRNTIPHKAENPYRWIQRRNNWWDN